MTDFQDWNNEGQKSVTELPLAVRQAFMKNERARRRAKIIKSAAVALAIFVAGALCAWIWMAMP